MIKNCFKNVIIGSYKFFLVMGFKMEIILEYHLLG